MFTPNSLNFLKKRRAHLKSGLSTSNPHSICLLSSMLFNPYKFMERNFTITTNNSSGKFNKYLLSKTSSDILSFIKENPNDLQFHINIQDENKVIEKFEKLYQGETVEFNKNDISISSKIIDHLHLSINFVKHYFTTTSIVNFTQNNKIYTINIVQNLNEYIENIKHKFSFSLFTQENNNFCNFINAIPEFTIQTKKRKYKCNKVGIQSSTVIREFLSKNKDSDLYYYDFEDENEEFNLICDIFNFKRIELSKDNAEIIKEISEDLNIECVIDSIEKYFTELDKVSQAIDDQQKLIDRIDELFNILYHIKEKTVETVSEFIYDSKWSKTEESVIELAAFILQVINSNISLHPYLIDLIIILNESDNNELKKLLPFVIKRIMLSFSKKINNQKCNSSELIYPFVYQLLKRDLIKIDELSEKLTNFTKYDDSFFISWFLPEIMKYNPKIKDFKLKKDCKGKNLLINSDNATVKLLYPCDPNEIKLDNYMKMRDKGEYDNNIANALRIDDVDTFQSIVTNSVENLLNQTIEPNMFEPFSIKNTSFLNYAAAYGSIKCFKYLLLNDEKIDDSTFDMAIIGGNNEIIRIVDNERIKQKQKPNQKSLKLRNNIVNNIPKITNAIIEHKNDIFDWILEQNAEIKNGNNNLLPLVICSIENGNAHSLIQLIDNGFNFHNNLDKCPRLIEAASERGFYLLVKLLLKLINKNSNKGILIDPKSTVDFGNISIFMLFENDMKQDDLETSLLCAIGSNNMKIIKYFFEVLINQNFKLDSKNAVKILENSVQDKSNEIFDYLIEKIEYLCPLDSKLLFNVIKKAYKVKNAESAISIIELINKKSTFFDFTEAFSHALKANLKEIIQYFIDKKYQVNYDDIAENICDITSINIDIFDLLMNNADSSIQNVLKIYINKAIKDKNKPLIKYLLNKDSLLDNSLIEAVRTNDLEIVDMILEKNSSPYYINQNFQSGTALYLSIQSKRTEIFNRLITVPGIDLNIYHKNYQTPLTLAASQLNEHMFKSILKLYGNDIVKQKWQLENAAKSIIEEYTYQNIVDVKISMLAMIIDLKCINPNFCCNEDTLLTFACKSYAKDIVESLLQYENIDPNIYSSETGDTPLIAAIKTNDFDIFKLIVNHPKTNINQRNYEGKTALTYAVENEDIQMIDILLENERFNPKESNINFAFFISNDINISKKLLTYECLDVNYIQYNYHDEESTQYYISETQSIFKTQLIKSILYVSNDLFDLIVQHPSFDKSQKQLRNAIFVALLENKIEMFKKILTMFTDIDINSRVFNGNSLLVEALIGNRNYDPITGKKQNNYIDIFASISKSKYIKEEANFLRLIMSYPTFDSKKSDIAYAFTHYITKQKIDNDSSELMNILYDYDCKHYHLIDSEIEKNGTNILISLIDSYHANNEFIKFMLEHGVDVNKPDKKGVYPLEEAIKNKKANISLFLVNSNKIDFNQKIHDKLQTEKFTTYLHLAVTNNLIDVINQILSNHLCDINITNDLGETPLMEACKEKKIDCVNTLFKYDDLDFTHKNNKGEDAIQISKNLFAPNDDKIDEELDIKDDIDNNKDEYLAVLLKILNIKQQSKTNMFRMLNH